MTNRKATFIFMFLFVIPYVSAQVMIGIAYNALVLHSDSWWRSLIGAVVGATLLFFAKIPLERPLRILGKYTTSKFIHLSVRFFILEEARASKQILNYLIDVVLAFASTYALRWFFPGAAGKALLMGTPFGWVVAILFISICIGAYLDFDMLSIVPKGTKISNHD